jgi:hypothetical protein
MHPPKSTENSNDAAGSSLRLWHHPVFGRVNPAMLRLLVHIARTNGRQR